MQCFFLLSLFEAHSKVSDERRGGGRIKERGAVRSVSPDLEQTGAPVEEEAAEEEAEEEEAAEKTEATTEAEVEETEVEEEERRA